MTARGASPDLDRLESYLAATLDADVTGTAVLNDGLNLSVAVETDGEGRAYVVRRPNKLRHTGLFNELRVEHRVLQRMRETPIPAPEPVAFCDDESVLGDPFLVVTHLDGETVPLGADLPERFRDAESRRRVAELLVDALAEIHSVDAEPFEGACDRQTPRDQVDVAVERLDAAARVTGREYPRLREVGEWLRRNAPEGSATTLVHGDFRPGNALFDGTDRPELTGVIDWETAMLGDPLTELGYLLLRWRDDGDPTPPLDDLEARYDDPDAIEYLRAVNERGLSPFTANPGSPTRRELVARYEAATGISFENGRFYVAHAAFMLATVWADLHRQHAEAGEESDLAPRVEYAAMVAESIVDGEFRV